MNIDKKIEENKAIVKQIAMERSVVIWKNIRKAAKKQGVKTQAHIAELTNTDKSDLSKLGTGKKELSDFLIAKLAAGLGVDVEDVVRYGNEDIVETPGATKTRTGQRIERGELDRQMAAWEDLYNETKELNDRYSKVIDKLEAKIDTLEAEIVELKSSGQGSLTRP